MSNPISNLKSLDLLRPQDLNCNVFSVYDYDGFSIQELLCEFFEKINECVEISNATFKLAEWLVSVGLAQEVAKMLEKWLLDGTLATIINETIFKELNEKINNYKKLMDDIVLNVKYFGAKGDGSTDDILSIQQTIDKAYELGGGTVLFPQGSYKISVPVYLPSRVKLLGQNGNKTTTILKVKGGINTLDSSIDFKTISRETLIQYDACVVMEIDGAFSSIEGINLKSFDDKNISKWGILAPFTQVDIFKDLNVFDFEESIRMFNAWNMNFIGIRTIRSTYGFRLEGNKPDFVGANTSWVFDRVFCEYVDYAYKFVGLQYSSLNGICCDQVNKRGYAFNYCNGISLQGMGMENSTGQILLSYFSQISINGFLFLEIKPTETWEGSKNALIEVENQGRLGCGLVIKSGEFKSDTSGKFKFYGSYHSTISVENVRNWDGKTLNELEPTSQCKFFYDNFDDIFSNKPIRVNDLQLDTIKSSYATGKYYMYPGILTYIDVGNGNGVTSLRLSKSKISKVFDWIATTDNYMYIPLKISVTETFNGSTNHIWNAQNSVDSSNITNLGSGSFVSSISVDSNDLILNFNRSVSRIKVAISIA